ncbi:MAG: transporter [Frankiales bacterium]|nr:transporter [Frankiales bacterium]
MSRTASSPTAHVVPGSPHDEARPTSPITEPEAPAKERTGPFRSLRVRNYRLYFSGQLISLTGTWAQRVAQDWLVLQLTNSGTALGVVTALQFLPSLLLSMYGGALADRGNKRRLLLMTQTGMGLVALLLGLLDVSGHVQLWHVFVLAGALGVISSIDTPIRQSFVVEMVGPADLPNAVALNSTAFNLARILGPAVAGIVISAVGTGWAFIGNATSTMAVLLGLTLMRTAELFPSKPVDRAPGQYRDALRYVRARSDLVLPMLLVFIIGTFGMNYQITIALMAKQVFLRGADSFGLLSTSLAVGATLGALAATFRRRRPTRFFLICASIAFGVTEIAASVMPSFDLTALMLVPAGLAMITFAQSCNATVQLGVEPTMRGRVMGLYLICFLGGTPLGAPIVGWLASVVGPRWGMLGGGVISLVSALVLGVWLGRQRHVTVSDLLARGRLRFGEAHRGLGAV